MTIVKVQTLLWICYFLFCVNFNTTCECLIVLSICQWLRSWLPSCRAAVRCQCQPSLCKVRQWMTDPNQVGYIYAPVRGLSKTYFSLHFFLDKIFLCFSCFISYLFICVVVNCAHYVDASISLSLKHEEWVTLGLVIQGRYWRCCSGRLGLESRTPASRFSIARREDRLGLQDASSTALAVR